MDIGFNVYLVLDELRKRKKIFRDENDFRQELVDTIQDMYDNVRVKVEYPAPFNTKKGIDIVVVMDNEYYPIELKYKRKSFKGIVDNIEYDLPSDNAQNENCYRAVKDIKRIEDFRDNEPLFKKGYTVFLTNDLSYMNKPREDSQYMEFSVHENSVKTGTLNWKRENPKTGFEEPITLKGTYTMNWKEYSNLNDEKSGTFMYLVNEIDK